MRAGQFALVRDPNTFDPYLRRTAWLYHIENGRVIFAVRADDGLTRRLQPGNLIDVLAPIGNTITFATSIKHGLLVGEDEHITHLIAIAQAALTQNLEIVLVHHALAPDKIFPAHLLAPEIEYHTDPANNDLLMWADALVLSGSDEFYRTMAERVRDARYRLESGFARALIDRSMPCGTGECFTCAIDTRNGIKRTCVEGPWFDLKDLQLRGAQ